MDKDTNPDPSIITEQDLKLFPIRNGVLCLSGPEWWERTPDFPGEAGDFEHWNGEKP